MSAVGAVHEAQPALGACAALLAALCMSGYVLLSERTTRRHDEAGFLLLRQLIATACMLLIAGARHGWQRIFLPPSDRDMRWLGAFQFLNAALFLHGVALAGGFVASVAQLSIPVLTFAYTSVTGLERPSLRRLAAMLTIVTGCALTACGHASAVSMAARDAVGDSVGRRLLGISGLPQSIGAGRGLRQRGCCC